jgi:thioredoxin-related protein
MVRKVVWGLLLAVCMIANTDAKPIPKQKKDLWQKWKVINELMQKEPKPVIIDIYTNWCVYCKVMDATTYRNDSVYAYLKNNYYRFKFNAEGRDTLTWQNKLFAYNKRYEVHDFAVFLTKGMIAYPTTVIIMPDGQSFYKQGQLKLDEMELLLKYFGRKNYDAVSLLEYTKSFKGTWR